MQLHQTQPSRSFQCGPWNQTALASESPKVVLNHSPATLGMSYEKLAAIAALIAVAVCSSLLFLQPNSISISSSGDTGKAARPLSPMAEKPSEKLEKIAVGGAPAPGVAATPNYVAQSGSPSVESRPEPLTPSMQALLQCFSKVSSGK